MKIATLEQGNERLLILAGLLEGLARKRFDYSEWVGLRLDRSGTPVDAKRVVESGADMWVNPYSWCNANAGNRIFHLDQDEANYLFVPGYRDDSPPETATAKQVAKHIRKFVARRAKANA